ncbi:ATP-binding cassette sub-family C member 9-like [Amphiura filiformis]|uniref:ATP-binding cassette sub-family C member 9-like n=1 Tax=Amphiura filiformis TaxID=82378 RepID=UPI003B21BA32
MDWTARYFTVKHPIVAVVVSLFYILGTSVWFGLAVYILLFPVNIIGSKALSSFEKKTLVLADERVKHTHEFLKEIKLLKLYAWEHAVCQNIKKLRRKENRQVLYRNIVMSLTAICSNAIPLLMALVSFGTYTWLSGNQLIPEVVFPSLALFNLLEAFLNQLPPGISAIVSGYVSTKRLDAFLLHGNETATDSNEEVKCDIEMKYVANGISKDKPGASVQFVNCSLAWDKKNAVLKNIDTEIETGKLTIIVGPVGSGKSALLAAILEEMILISGVIKFPR